MEFHFGRLIDHVHLRVSDLAASKRFYRAVIASLGRPNSLVEGSGRFHIDELFVDGGAIRLWASGIALAPAAGLATMVWRGLRT